MSGVTGTLGPEKRHFLAHHRGRPEVTCSSCGSQRPCTAFPRAQAVLALAPASEEKEGSKRSVGKGTWGQSMRSGRGWPRGRLGVGEFEFLILWQVGLCMRVSQGRSLARVESNTTSRFGHFVDLYAWISTASVLERRLSGRNRGEGEI